MRDLRPVGGTARRAPLRDQHALQEPAVGQPDVPQVAAVLVPLAAGLVGSCDPRAHRAAAGAAAARRLVGPSTRPAQSGFTDSGASTPISRTRSALAAPYGDERVAVDDPLDPRRERAPGRCPVGAGRGSVRRRHSRARRPARARCRRRRAPADHPRPHPVDHRRAGADGLQPSSADAPRPRRPRRAAATTAAVDGLGLRRERAQRPGARARRRTGTARSPTSAPRR